MLNYSFNVSSFAPVTTIFLNIFCVFLFLCLLFFPQQVLVQAVVLLYIVENLYPSFFNLQARILVYPQSVFNKTHARAFVSFSTY